MRLFWTREAKSAAPLAAIADLRAAQSSGTGQLAREEFEKNAMVYRCVRMIALAFGVPPVLLRIPGDATYASYREANSTFCRLTVLPLVNKAARAISGWLDARVGGGVASNLGHVPAFQMERAEQRARIDAASFLTV